MGRQRPSRCATLISGPALSCTTRNLAPDGGPADFRIWLEARHARLATGVAAAGRPHAETPGPHADCLGGSASAGLRLFQGLAPQASCARVRLGRRCALPCTRCTTTTPHLGAAQADAASAPQAHDPQLAPRITLGKPGKPAARSAGAAAPPTRCRPPARGRSRPACSAQSGVQPATRMVAVVTVQPGHRWALQQSP